MKKVLMLCYYYPPKASAGTWRSLAFAKELHGYGWFPTVMTATKSLLTSLSSPEPLDAPATGNIKYAFELDLTGPADFFQGALSRLAKSFGNPNCKLYVKDLLLFPDPQQYWWTTIPSLLLAKHHDVLYASCSPFSSAVSACLVKRILGTPVVLDFRDLWYYDIPSYHIGLYHTGLRALEGFVVSSCDALILNSEGARRVYADRFPESAAKMTVIPNGYDALSLAPPKPPRTRPFSILHVGNFYGTRTSEPILRALELMSNGDVELIHVGAQDPTFQRYRATVRTRELASVSREEALQLLHGASLLYLRQSLNNSIAIAGKTFEYLATGLPILAHCPRGDNFDLVQRYSKQSFTVATDDPQEIAASIQAAIDADGASAPEISRDFIRDFDRRTLTGRLADVLTKVAAGEPPQGLQVRNG